MKKFKLYIQNTLIRTYNVKITLFSEKILIFILTVFPRIPLVFHSNGHYDANSILSALGNWIKFHRYIPTRHPGAPVYEAAAGITVWLGEVTGIPRLFGPQFQEYPSFLLCNFLSLLTTFIFLQISLEILKRYFSNKWAWYILILYNFYPHTWVMGGATTDMNFLLLWSVLSFESFLEKKDRKAIFFSVLAVGSRIQGLALAFPLIFAIIFRNIREKNPTFAIKNTSLFCILVFLMLMLPFSWYGFQMFSPGAHSAEMSTKMKVGGAILRLINAWGPCGASFLIATLVKYLSSTPFLKFLKPSSSFQSDQDPSTSTFLLGYLFCSLAISARVLGETFYLLPITLLSFAFFIKITESFRPISRTLAVATFSFSVLLPNLIQFQWKPWKFPFYEIHKGVLHAHWNSEWVIRGGG